MFHRILTILLLNTLLSLVLTSGVQAQDQQIWDQDLNRYLTPQEMIQEDVYLTPEEAAKLIADGDALEHSHTLTEQLGGQIDAGFHIVGMYEDYHSGTAVSDYTPTYIATRALKP